MDVREKLEVIAHLGDHITYKEDIGICYDSALAKVIEDAYMTLKSCVTVQEWISVKDRLPNICEPVLVCCDFMGGKAFQVSDRYGKNGMLWAGIPESHKVTHWMPLPQPPKGD